MDWMKLLENGLALFIVVDPLGLVPVYWGMTARMSAEERRRTTNIAIISGVSILLVFSIGGQWLLAHAFNITTHELMVVGGLLLLLLGVIGTVFGERFYVQEVAQASSASIGAVPVGCPLLAGPGAITATILTVNAYPSRLQGVAAASLLVVLVFSVVWVILRFTAGIQRVLGSVGSLVVTRLTQILLAAIGVHYLAAGMRGLITGQ
jgi:multiple antibiotic resistance protein